MAATADDAELCVLLTPRALGGHEAALLGWLVDAVRCHGLRPRIAAPGAALARRVADAGLAPSLWPAPAGALAASAQAGGLAHPARPAAARLQLLQALRRWPLGRPLLLAPGVLHAGAWLLAAALALGHQVWVYVPMAYSARRMGYARADLRDRLLAPWLRRVHRWVTLDARQAAWLQAHWRLAAPVHLLPNIARLPAAPPPVLQPAADDRLRVAYVGRFDAAQKGLDWLAQALQARADWHGAYRWHFQGDGPAELDLLTLASALGPQQVQVHGHAPLQQALACSDVLLLPSRYEGVPLVALEATALGWPVAASHEAGLDHLLPRRSLFRFGDADDLQRALQTLRRPAARVAAVAHAQDRLQQAHSPARYQQALAALVLGLRAGPSVGPAC